MPHVVYKNYNRRIFVFIVAVQTAFYKPYLYNIVLVNYLKTYETRTLYIKWKMSQPDHIEPDVVLFVGDQATLETGSCHSYNAARERRLCVWVKAGLTRSNRVEQLLRLL